MNNEVMLNFAAVPVPEKGRPATTFAEQPVLSVVIPTYNAEQSLKSLYERLITSISQITANFEIVFVEDCGPDRSWQCLRELAQNNPYIRAIKLSRNFGQHAAITAGLSACKGQWAVVMDCDLQDPPEDILKLWQKAQEGYDIVLAKRIGKKQSFIRQMVSAVYFKLLELFTMSHIDGDYGTFSIISRKVVDAYLNVKDKNRHYLMILQWLGFKRTSVEYQHGERHHGTSSYSFVDLIRHAIQGLFFQTTVLLQTIVGIGLLVSLCGAIGVVWTIWHYLAYSAQPGWSSIIVVLLTIGGMIIVSLGVIGLYIGQIFDQVKQRPLFVMDQEIRSEE